MNKERQTLNRNLAQMLKGGVIMDVTTLNRLRLLRLQVLVPLWLLSAFLLTFVQLVACRA